MSFRVNNFVEKAPEDPRAINLRKLTTPEGMRAFTDTKIKEMIQKKDPNLKALALIQMADRDERLGSISVVPILQRIETDLEEIQEKEGVEKQRSAKEFFEKFVAPFKLKFDKEEDGFTISGKDLSLDDIDLEKYDFKILHEILASEIPPTLEAMIEKIDVHSDKPTRIVMPLIVNVKHSIFKFSGGNHNVSIAIDINEENGSRVAKILFFDSQGKKGLKNYIINNKERPYSVEELINNIERKLQKNYGITNIKVVTPKNQFQNGFRLSCGDHNLLLAIQLVSGAFSFEDIIHDFGNRAKHNIDIEDRVRTAALPILKTIYDTEENIMKVAEAADFDDPE